MIPDIDIWRCAGGLLASSCVGVFICVVLLCRLAMAEDHQVTFRDPARNISFSYDGTLWQTVRDPNPATITTIRKRYLESEEYTRCELRAHKSDYATRVEGHVHAATYDIATRFMGAARRHNPESRFIDLKTTSAGAQELVELQLYSAEDDFLLKRATKVIAIYTALDGEEVIFSCSYATYVDGDSREGHWTEADIRAVMKTLSFGN